MAYYIKVDVSKVAAELYKKPHNWHHAIPKHYAMTAEQIIAELVEMVREQRLALTDAEFRRRFVDFIKK